MALPCLALDTQVPSHHPHLNPPTKPETEDKLLYDHGNSIPTILELVKGCSFGNGPHKASQNSSR